MDADECFMRAYYSTREREKKTESRSSMSISRGSEKEKARAERKCARSAITRGARTIVGMPKMYAGPALFSRVEQMRRRAALYGGSIDREKFDIMRVRKKVGMHR